MNPTETTAVINYILNRDCETMGNFWHKWLHQCHASLDHFLLEFHLYWLPNGLWCLPELLFRSLCLSAAPAAALSIKMQALPLSGARQLIALISSPAALVVGLGGTLYLPGPSSSLTTLSLWVNGLWGLNLDCGWSPLPQINVGALDQFTGICSGMFSRLC